MLHELEDFFGERYDGFSVRVEPIDAAKVLQHLDDDIVDILCIVFKFLLLGKLPL